MSGRGCTLPPAGWYCSRAPGHEGPCAARMTRKLARKGARKARRLARAEAAQAKADASRRTLRLIKAVVCLYVVAGTLVAVFRC